MDGHALGLGLATGIFLFSAEAHSDAKRPVIPPKIYKRFQGTFRSEPRAQGLRYRLQIRMQGEATPMELYFRLHPTASSPAPHKRARNGAGGWRLEAERGQGFQVIPAWILVRAQRLLYVSGPVSQLHRESWNLTIGQQACPVWTVPVPPTLKANVNLVEIAPYILALGSLHATFEEGEFASIDLRLEAFGWEVGTALPENGTALLGSLQHWAQLGEGEAERVE